MVLAGWQLTLRTDLQTDMSAFMPAGEDQVQQLLLRQLEQGPAARLWMVALTNGPAESLAELARELMQKAGESPLVEHVVSGNMVLDEPTRSLLSEYRYLLSDRISPSSFTQAGLRQMLGELLEVLRSPLSTFSKSEAEKDPGGEFLHLLNTFRRGAGTYRCYHRTVKTKVRC